LFDSLYLTFRTCGVGNSRFSAPRFQADLSSPSTLLLVGAIVLRVLVHFFD